MEDKWIKYGFCMVLAWWVILFNLLIKQSDY